MVASAFALKTVGDVSDPVSTDKGFVILKLTEHKPALSRSLDEAKMEIQRRLLDDLRARKKKDFIEEARRQIKVEIFEDQLAKLDLAAAVAAGAQRPGIDAGAMLGTRP